MKPLVRFRSKLQGWGGEGRVKFEPIRIESRLGPSAFTGESWLVTSRARFGAGYFGIEPGTWSNLFPDRRSRNPTLVLFTFSNLIQPLSRSNNLYLTTCEIYKHTNSCFIRLFSSFVLKMKIARSILTRIRVSRIS